MLNFYSTNINDYNSIEEIEQLKEGKDYFEATNGLRYSIDSVVNAVYEQMNIQLINNGHLSNNQKSWLQRAYRRLSPSTLTNDYAIRRACEKNLWLKIVHEISNYFSFDIPTSEKMQSIRTQSGQSYSKDKEIFEIANTYKNLTNEQIFELLTKKLEFPFDFIGNSNDLLTLANKKRIELVIKIIDPLIIKNDDYYKNMLGVFLNIYLSDEITKFSKLTMFSREKVVALNFLPAQKLIDMGANLNSHKFAFCRDGYAINKRESLSLLGDIILQSVMQVTELMPSNVAYPNALSNLFLKLIVLGAKIPEDEALQGTGMRFIHYLKHQVKIKKINAYFVDQLNKLSLIFNAHLYDNTSPLCLLPKELMSIIISRSTDV